MTNQTRSNGQIYRRDGRWRWRYQYRDMAGNRRGISGGPCDTKAEAADAMAAARAALVIVGRPASSALTVADYLRRWHSQYAARVKPTTAAAARFDIEAYIIPRIGGTALVDLARAEVRAMLDDLATNGRTGVNGAGGLAPKSLRNILGTIHGALRDAVADDLIDSNPAAEVRIARSHRPVRRVWDRNDLAAFVAATTADEYHAIWRLVAVTGMRRGEVLGLRWSDLDLLAGTVMIEQSRVSDGRQILTSTPKTRAGRRSLAIDAGTVDALARLANTQDDAARRLGIDPPLLVASLLDGRPLRTDGLVARFHTAAKRAGLPRCRFHDLRHTVASIWLEDGVAPHIVAGRLGHSSAAFTQSQYAEYLPNADRDAANRFGAWIDSRCANGVPTSENTAALTDIHGDSLTRKSNIGAGGVTNEDEVIVPPLGFEPRGKPRKSE